MEEMSFNQDIEVYELSAHGAIFKYLKKRFKNLTYSEFFDGIAPGSIHKGILCQDVQQLTFSDSSFDLITSTEVFEHVADDRKGFKEVYRVLKNGGLFVFTVPLYDILPETVERARLENGKLVFLNTPTYGGDHLRREGILDFRNYGMDIDKRLKEAGFSEVIIKDVSDLNISIPRKQVIVAMK